jgi:hypothetical protein
MKGSTARTSRPSSCDGVEAEEVCAPEGVGAVDVPPASKVTIADGDRAQHVLVEPREARARRLGAHQRVAGEHQPVGERTRRWP